MKKTISILLIAVGLTAGNAVAQTARIAHLSHGGSLAALDAAVDNFGRIQPPYFEVDSIRLISDTVAVGYGNWHRTGNQEKTLRIRMAARIEQKPERLTKQQLVREYQHYQPKVKLIGFDSVQMSTPGPALQKHKVKRKKSTFTPIAPAPPQHPGVALGVALVLGLAGAGWLLGERRAVAGS